jgi:4-hydroxy-3-polyprenylbenzoate decarboxylase
MPPAATNRVILGISGASGAIYAQRMLRLLLDSGREVHLVVTDYGRRLLMDELSIRPVELHKLADLPDDIDPRDRGLFIHPIKDVGANIASGSFLHDGMIIMPCSSHTLGAVASGLGDNLLTRAAAVTLKERRPLVLCHRESPLTRIDIQNMDRLTGAGAVIAPTNPGFYLHPQSLDDIIDFVVGRTLDLIGVEHNLNIRWKDEPADEESRA